MNLRKNPPIDDGPIARLTREHGPALMEQVVKALVAGAVIQDEMSAEQEAKKPSVARRLASAALVRVATKSVPGAIIVSGGLIAKTLYDRHKARQAAGVPARQR